MLTQIMIAARRITVLFGFLLLVISTVTSCAPISGGYASPNEPPADPAVVGRFEGVVQGEIQPTAHYPSPPALLFLIQDDGTRIPLGPVTGLSELPKGNQLYDGDRVIADLDGAHIISFEILREDAESRSNTGPLVGWREG